MQRHGGSNRLLPKAAQLNAALLKPVPEHGADGAEADPAQQSRDEPSIAPDRR
jgi:hypothetical protein